MRLPFDGQFPVSRGYIKHDDNMPIALRDPIYGPTHRGIDYALPFGITLKAAVSGSVTYAGWSADGAGNIVVIKSGTLLVKTFHMAKVSVALGQSVREGDVIGTSGNSGSSTGPHLHLQVEEGLGNAVDPAKYLNVTDVKEVPVVTEGLLESMYRVLFTKPGQPERKLDAAARVYVGQPMDKVYETLVNSQEAVETRQAWRKALQDATGIAGIRADRLKAIAEKVQVDNPDDFDKLLSAISLTDSDKKIQQIKEIVKE